MMPRMVMDGHGRKAMMPWMKSHDAMDGHG